MVDNNFLKENLDKIDKAEKLLGYQFKDKTLLLRAITHPSAVRGTSKLYSYERLEFLGDSLLSAIVSKEAYIRYPNMDEGKLTHVRVALVSGSTLSGISKDLGFNDLIIFGKSITNTGNRGIKSALENVFESIVAALYLDGGLEIAKKFVKDNLFVKMKNDGKLSVEDSPKSILQEKLQATKHTPKYCIIDEFGPAHDKTFIAEVMSDNKVLAKGKGKTKKEAETNAALAALELI